MADDGLAVAAGATARRHGNTWSTTRWKRLCSPGTYRAARVRVARGDLVLQRQPSYGTLGASPEQTSGKSVLQAESLGHPGVSSGAARQPLAALRDFGVLAGAVKKRLARPYLPIAAFAYIAFALGQQESSGYGLVHSPEWRLFFLDSPVVERLFVEAQQERLLTYHAAGRVVRVDFPAETSEEYAHALLARAH